MDKFWKYRQIIDVLEDDGLMYSDSFSYLTSII